MAKETKPIRLYIKVITCCRTCPNLDTVPHPKRVGDFQLICKEGAGTIDYSARNMLPLDCPLPSTTT